MPQWLLCYASMAHVYGKKTMDGHLERPMTENNNKKQTNKQKAGRTLLLCHLYHNMSLLNICFHVLLI